MARYTGPKDRLSRRENFDLFSKGSKLTRLSVLPGVHGPKGTRRAPSQYGRQLREKQKVKRYYGVMERQFKNYVDRALRVRGNTGDELFSLLESRLDNIIFRLGFAKSRPQARQLVSHRHVYVNGKRVNIPSYQARVGDSVSLSATALEIPFIAEQVKKEAEGVPDWLKRKGPAGKVVRKPMRDDVTEPFVEADIVEYYSR